MAERKRESHPSPAKGRGTSERIRELEELRAEMGSDFPPDLLMELEDLQKVAEAGIDLQDPQAIETALRKLEYERIKREFKPRVPLYGMRVGEGEEMAKDKEAPKTPPSDNSSAREKRRRSYQEDPRYRAFYERLKNRQQQESSKYDEPPEFSSLEELEQTGWDGTPRPWEQKRKTSASPSGTTVPRPTTPPPPLHDEKEAADELVPGTILRFDDGSIAIYKDAVSGKDYALFYFLEPNGVLVPQGIFLDQYERQRLGLLPPDLFEAMIRMRRWDRDAVIYHLDRFEYAGHIRAIAAAQPMRVEGGDEPPPTAPPRPVSRPPRASSAVESPSVSTPAYVAPEAESEPVPPPSVELPPPPPRTLLERGRVIRIVVGPGKVWEAVYWTSDELGPIVAHNTNREWSLMHLDLARFKDAIEYGDLLSDEELKEIENSLARQG